MGIVKEFFCEREREREKKKREREREMEVLSPDLPRIALILAIRTGGETVFFLSVLARRVSQRTKFFPQKDGH